MPRETFVGFCGEPSQVFIQFATASTSTTWVLSWVGWKEEGVWTYCRSLLELVSLALSLLSIYSNRCFDAFGTAKILLSISEFLAD